jgi:hypothetical protein
MQAARSVGRGPIPVKLIPLDEPVRERTTEVSGMTWDRDELLVLPQYGGKLFAFDKADLARAVDAPRPKAPKSREIQVLPTGFERAFPGFQGFEAIAAANGRLYFLVEAKVDDRMVGYLVSGTRGAVGIELDLSKVRRLPVPTTLDNLGYEALAIVDNRILAIPELNGRGLNPTSRARVFDFDLNELEPERLPVIDYRVTDATDADAEGRFWVSNYNHPGDEGMPEAPVVERLVPLKSTSRGVIAFGEPLNFERTEFDGRNWEAVVPFDQRGFLLMTDMYPRTMLGFVAEDITPRQST